MDFLRLLFKFLLNTSKEILELLDISIKIFCSDFCNINFGFVIYIKIKNKFLFNYHRTNSNMILSVIF